MRQEKQPLYIDIAKRFLIFGIFDKMKRQQECKKVGMVCESIPRLNVVF